MNKLIVIVMMSLASSAFAADHCPNFQGKWKKVCVEQYSYFTQINTRTAMVQYEIGQTDCKSISVDGLTLDLKGKPEVKAESGNSLGDPSDPLAYVYHTVDTQAASLDPGSGLVTVIQCQMGLTVGEQRPQWNHSQSYGTRLIFEKTANGLMVKRLVIGDDGNRAEVQCELEKVQ
jgi:hypothetical protein